MIGKTNGHLVSNEYVKNQNKLSAYAPFSISSDTSNPTVCQYDGYIVIMSQSIGNISETRLTLNGVQTLLFFSQASSTSDIDSTSVIPVSKGDELVLTGRGDNKATACWFDQRDYS
ncbi:MAG: hypothetical protein J6S67_05205 [Methanobrevibacter sp.]|nr:hypothetical protein [Methanobrevibacter sp.]